jgi:hypothetical protein
LRQLAPASFHSYFSVYASINRQKNECVIKMAEPPAREFASCPDHYEALSRHSKKRSTESILQTTVLPQAGTANGRSIGKA